MSFIAGPIGGGGGGSSNGFTIFQGTAGTSPTAIAADSTITFESSDSSVSLTGNDATNTFDVKALFPVKTASNVGSGAGQVFKTLSGTDLQFKKIAAGTSITITDGVSDVTIDASVPVQSVTNVGTGTGTLFTSISGTAAQLKTIKAGTNVTITNNTSDVTIAAASGLSISGTDKAVVRMSGTAAIQESGVFVADVVSSATSMYPAASTSLTISTDGAKTSAGGGNAWIDFYTPASGRMRYLHASYSTTVGAVEWSALRVFHRIPVCFDGSYGIGKRTDGTLERPTEVHVANWIGVGAGASPTTSVVAEFTSTTGAVLFPRMTTTQRDALTAVNGMVIYNTSTDKLQVRAAAIWVDLH